MLPSLHAGRTAAALTLLALVAPAQESAPQAPEPEEPRATSFATTFVTATKSERAAFEVPYSIDRIDAEEFRRRGTRTMPRMLLDTPGVLVQETSHGQGSPFIRGFTAYRNVFLIDGIRLNNSVFRSGPNQYWNTVDPYSISGLEIVKGPSSVLYGSDAIGGTVNVQTMSPQSYGAGPLGSLHYRYSEAEQSHVSRIQGDVTFGESTGLLVGVTGKDYGDVRAGDPTGTQPGTGYDEWDADMKLEHWLEDDLRLVLAYQQVRQDDVPRTHRTQDAISFEGSSVGSDLQRDLDQDRRLAYAQLIGEDFLLSLSYQQQEEEQDRIRSSGARQLQGFEVDTIGLFGHMRKETGIGTLTFGFDAYHDEVESFSTTNPIQGPVGDDARYDNIGVYLQNELEATDTTSVIVGARFNYIAAEADSVQDPTGPGAISVDDDWSKLVGSIRFVQQLTAGLNLFGGVSQGFRAPSLSDLTRLDQARTNEFEIASPGLDSEDYFAYELGLKQQGEKSSGELAVFYTDIQNMIVRTPTGNTNADGDFEVVKDNLGDGYAFGVELSGACEVADGVTLWGNASYLTGRADTFPTEDPVIEEEYLDRLMPTNVLVGVDYEPDDANWWTRGTARWVDDADRLSTRDEGDDSRIPPGGTPGFVLVGLAGGMQVSDHTRFDIALNNLLDEDYRWHGSGSNSPGRNLIVSLTITN